MKLNLVATHVKIHCDLINRLREYFVNRKVEKLATKS